VPFTHTLNISLVDANGHTFTDPATVVAALGDDQSIMAKASTTDGQVHFQNMPDRTIFFKAIAANNQFGFVGITGAEGGAQVKLTGFGPPSTINNNDLSQGTAGWDIGSAPVTIVPHQEGTPGGLLAAAQSVTPQFAAATPAPSQAQDAAPNNDLVLTTSGEGEQSISRTFTTDPGTSEVVVRYRFITSEVPGGFFGSKYNDYFRVSIRSEKGGGFAGESNSMNALGLAAFDYASGATQWREEKLPVSVQGDTIRVDAAVANVGDALYDSQVVIDFIEEKQGDLQLSLAWDNIQGGLNLTYTVINHNLTQDTPINVYWANGADYASRLNPNAPVFTYTVKAGANEGFHDTIHIDGSHLKGAPAGTTHLIAASNEDNASAVQDVQLGFGPNANKATVSAYTLDALKDLLRAAGQSTATINSTARTPADQARAMFQNLTNSQHTIAQNIAIQHGIYAAPGDAVIDVFAEMVQGMTLQQILANQTAIRAAMEQEIINQGPSNVSKHCADPATMNVVDISANSFNDNNGPLFVKAAQSDSRVSKVIDERTTNNCYHLQIPQ
jgi:hypothetical protein